MVRGTRLLLLRDELTPLVVPSLDTQAVVAAISLLARSSLAPQTTLLTVELRARIISIVHSSQYLVMIHTT